MLNLNLFLINLVKSSVWVGSRCLYNLEPIMKGRWRLIFYKISYGSTNPSKTFEINNLEEQFFEVLYSKLDSKRNNMISLIRMSNGTLSVYFKGYPVGKIKLQGRKHSMQILKSLYKYDAFEGNINDFIPKIDGWILYINKYIMREL